MRLVAANVAWGAGVITVVVMALAWPIAGLLLLPVLALPTAGVFRIASRIVRVEPYVGLGDIAWPYRHAAGTLLLFGAAVVAVGLVLGSNLVVGLGHDQPYAWALATLAGWGLLALGCFMVVAWPLLVDPARAARPVSDRLALAGRLLLVHPVRFGGLALAVALLLAASLVLTVAILTVSLSFIALVACRSVYPAADRLEAALDHG
jgi:hypothetical protein